MARDKNDKPQEPKTQLQSTSAEPEQQTKEDTSEGPTYFDTTIAKVKKDDDGNDIIVMSDYLTEGEKLKRDVDAEKAQQKQEERAQATREQNKK